jgi:hypothetical protein
LIGTAKSFERRERKDCAEDAKENRKQIGTYALKFVASCAVNAWTPGDFHLAATASDGDSVLEAMG